MKNKLLSLCLAAMLSMTLPTWADTAKLTTAAGWEKVTSLPTNTIGNYYYCIVDNSKDLMVQMAYGSDKQENKLTLWYRNSVEVCIDPSFIWTIEYSNTYKYGLRNLKHSSHLVQTRENAAFRVQAAWETAQSQWTQWNLAYANGYWTIENGLYPASSTATYKGYLGPWDEGHTNTDLIDGLEFAGNKSGNYIGHFQIYRILPYKLAQALATYVTNNIDKKLSNTNEAQAKLNTAVNNAKNVTSSTARTTVLNYYNALLTAIDDYVLGTVDESNPLDVTAQYVRAADFDYSYHGWKNYDGMALQGNTAFTLKSGNNYMERWVGKGNKVPDAELLQQLSGMPNGKYRLTCVAQNIQEGSTAKQTGVTMIADDQTVAISAANTYSIDFVVLDGSVKIGLVIENATGNYVCVDNFRLYYLGTSSSILTTEANRRKAAAQTLLTSNMDATVKTKLQTAINGLSGTSGDTYATLKAAYNAAVTSAANYALAATLTEVTSGLTVKTGDYIVRGSNFAVGRSTITGTYTEAGYCWSTTNKTPTVRDNKSKKAWDFNGKVYRMEDLNPSTVYYVRPYAINSSKQVAYGKPKKIITIQRGKTSYWFGGSSDPAIQDRIDGSIQEAIENFNSCTNCPAFNFSITYQPGTPTADCNYEGSMRVGPNVSYQRTGTIQHEMTHGLGVGVIARWNNNAALRADVTRGTWLGRRATLATRFWDNSTTSTLTGDNTHMWPYGINGANEDNSQQSLYIANATVVQALGEDGLPHTWSSNNAAPAWEFESVDDVKYYIKNENSSCGFASGYLMDENGTLKWKSISSTDVVKNDAYAWYVSFNADYGYYYIKNASTGKYISYDGSKFLTKTTATPGREQDLQMIVGHDLIELSSFSTESFWMFYPTSGDWTPPTFTATTTGGTSKTAFDFGNSAQRWIFLTAEQTSSIENGLVNVARDILGEEIKNATAVFNTAHAQVTAGADDAMRAALNTAKTQQTTLTNTAQLETAVQTLRQATLTFLGNAKTTTSTAFNLSYMLTNPSISSADGWSEKFAYGNNVGEYFQKTFDLNQTTPNNLPVGTYALTVQAYQRPGALSDDVDAAAVTTYMYANATQQTIKNIAEDSQTRNTYSNSTIDGKYVPNSMAEAEKYFNAGLYTNKMNFTLTANTAVKLGIKCTNSNNGYWTCFDNFQLLSYGNQDGAEVKDEVFEIVKWKAGETYYLYNIESGLFMCNGNNWGTRASVGENGLAWTLEADNGLYKLKNNYNTGAPYLYLTTAHEAWVDGANASLFRLTQDAATGYTTISINPADATYGTSALGTTYMGTIGDPVNTVVFPTMQYGNNYQPGIHWILMTAEQYMKYHPVAITVLDTRKSMTSLATSAFVNGVSVPELEVFANPSADEEALNTAAATFEASLTAAITSAASASTPVDLTYKVKSAHCGTDQGWTFNGFPGRQNAFYANGSTIMSDRFIETWVTSTTALGANALTQQISTLPAGHYRLSADAIACRQNSEQEIEGVNITIGNRKVNCSTGNGVPESYTTPYYTVAAGENVTLGITVESTNANWVAVDNFRLTYYGPGKVCDINRDGKVDLGDVNAMRAILLGDTANPAYDYIAADINGDDKISISDMAELIGEILK